MNLAHDVGGIVIQTDGEFGAHEDEDQGEGSDECASAEGGEGALADGLAEHDDGHGEELHELDGEPDAD